MRRVVERTHAPKPVSDAVRVLRAGWRQAVGSDGPAGRAWFAALQRAALHDYLKEQGEEK